MAYKETYQKGIKVTSNSEDVSIKIYFSLTVYICFADAVKLFSFQTNSALAM